MKPKQTIEVLEIIKRDYNTDITKQALDHAINCVGAIEQIKWERDIAIQQLNDLGYQFGEKIRSDELMAEIPKTMIVYVDEKVETKSKIDELEKQVEFQQMKINDLDFKLSQLDQREKHDRVINVVWTICVGIIIFLLAINY